VRFLLYIAIAFIIWRIVRGMMRPSTPRPTVRTTPREERVERGRGIDIDYTRVRDADYREIDERQRRRDEESRQGGAGDHDGGADEGLR
jgi:hypothetical protein